MNGRSSANPDDSQTGVTTHLHSRKFANMLLTMKIATSLSTYDGPAPIWPGPYDVVFAKSSLHHIENLEHAFRQIGHCPKPGGKLVTIDFFGPTRFHWTEQQLKIRSWFWRERVPSELRKDVQGREIPEVSRPDVDAMIAMDPSEAVRSGELYPLLKQHFTLAHDAELGGGLVNLLLYGDIVNSFDPDNETHNAVIREAFSLERMLMDVGALNSDFRLIVAEPSAPSPQPPKGWWSRLLGKQG